MPVAQSEARAGMSKTPAYKEVGSAHMMRSVEQARHLVERDIAAE
jgi:hypothetical protein